MSQQRYTSDGHGSLEPCPSSRALLLAHFHAFLLPGTWIESISGFPADELPRIRGTVNRFGGHWASSVESGRYLAERLTDRAWYDDNCDRRKRLDIVSVCSGRATVWPWLATVSSCGQPRLNPLIFSIDTRYVFASCLSPSGLGRAAGAQRDLDSRPKLEQDLRVRPHDAVIQIRHLRRAKANHKRVRNRFRRRGPGANLPMVVVNVERRKIELSWSERVLMSATRLPFQAILPKLIFSTAIHIFFREKSHRRRMCRHLPVRVEPKAF